MSVQESTSSFSPHHRTAGKPEASAHCVFRALRELDIIGCRELQFAQAVALPWMTELPSLERLRVDWAPEEVRDVLFRVPSLRRVHIGWRA
jgi:hypothetical protein